MFWLNSGCYRGLTCIVVDNQHSSSSFFEKKIQSLLVPKIGGNFGVWRIWRPLHTQRTHNDCKQYITYVNVRGRYCSFAAMKFNMCYMLKLQIAHRTMNVKTWNFHTWCILTLIFWLSIFFYIKFKTDVVYIKCIEHIQRSYVMMLTCKIFWTSKYFVTSHMKITWFDYMIRDLMMLLFFQCKQRTQHSNFNIFFTYTTHMIYATYTAHKTYTTYTTYTTYATYITFIWWNITNVW